MKRTIEEQRAAIDHLIDETEDLFPEDYPDGIKSIDIITTEEIEGAIEHWYDFVDRILTDDRKSLRIASDFLVHADCLQQIVNRREAIK